MKVPRRMKMKLRRSTWCPSGSDGSREATTKAPKAARGTSRYSFMNTSALGLGAWPVPLALCFRRARMLLCGHGHASPHAATQQPTRWRHFPAGDISRIQLKLTMANACIYIIYSTHSPDSPVHRLIIGKTEQVCFYLRGRAATWNASHHRSISRAAFDTLERAKHWTAFHVAQTISLVDVLLIGVSSQSRMHVQRQQKP